MREEFEKWCTNQCNYTLSKTADGTYRSMRTNLAFKVWQASRAAIEIEREPEHEWMGEYPSHDSFLDGYANGWNDCVDAITYHGIRIKGKTE